MVVCVHAGLSLDACQDFTIGRFALGLNGAERVRVDVDLDDNHRDAVASIA